MHGVTPPEHDEVTRREGQAVHLHHPVEYLGHPLERHVPGVGVADGGHVLESSTSGGGLQQHRDCERGVVEVPPQLVALGGEVEVDGRQVVVVGVDGLDAQDRAQERTERPVLVDVTEGRVGGDLVIGQQPLAAGHLAVEGMRSRKPGIRLRQVHVVGRRRVVRLVLPVCGRSDDLSDGLRREEAIEHQHAGRGKLLTAPGPVARILQGMAIQPEVRTAHPCVPPPIRIRPAGMVTRSSPLLPPTTDRHDVQVRSSSSGPRSPTDAAPTRAMVRSVPDRSSPSTWSTPASPAAASA